VGLAEHSLGIPAHIPPSQLLLQWVDVSGAHGVPCSGDTVTISPQDSVSIHTRSFRTTVRGVVVAGVPYQSCADLPENFFSMYEVGMNMNACRMCR